MGASDDEGGRRVAKGCRTEGACGRVGGQVVYFPADHGLFNTSNCVTQKIRGLCCERWGSPLRGKGEGVLSPDYCAFGNSCRSDQAFPLILVEVFHPEGKTFLRILERIEAIEKFTGG